jgi:hypothetical protein
MKTASVEAIVQQRRVYEEVHRCCEQARGIVRLKRFALWEMVPYDPRIEAHNRLVEEINARDAAACAMDKEAVRKLAELQ